jgi:hypothetical protein
MTGRTARVAAAVVVQLLLVGVAVWTPLVARYTGEEVRLRVGIADDYEPFADAYVDLAYPDLPQPHVPEGDLTEEQYRTLEDALGVAFVPLTREGDVWVGGELQREEPDSGPYLRCDDSSWMLDCGIGTAYLSTGTDQAVRDALRARDAVAVVRVDGAGHAALVEVTAGP